MVSPPARLEGSLIDHRFVLLALAFNVLGAGSYMVRLLRSEIQPHIVTWSIWALAPAVAFLAQLHDGVGLPSAITLFTSVSPATVVVVLLIRGNYLLDVTPFDVGCGLLSILGLALWLSLRETGFAVGFAILSDALASLPTYRKAIRRPGSESWITYGCLAVSALITLATVTEWSFARVGFLVYLAVLGSTMTATVLIGGRRARAGPVAAP
jgi:hypothetical protein